MSASKVPFQVAQPTADTISLKSPAAYAIKLTRETHATRSVMYLWTGEIASELQGYHVMAPAKKASSRFPRI